MECWSASEINARRLFYKIVVSEKQLDSLISLVSFVYKENELYSGPHLISIVYDYQDFLLLLFTYHFFHIYIVLCL